MNLATAWSSWLRGLIGWSILAYGSIANAVPTNHVLLLENSVAIGKADPAGQLRDGLATFIRGLPDNDRLAIVVFEDLATLVAPFTVTDSAGRAKLIGALNTLTFDSTWTNPAAGLERAIYELSSLPQDDASKARILLVQAGQIHTGNRKQDAAFRAWADKVLADRAVTRGITVDVVSLGANADRQLGHDLAQRTGGRHFAIATTDRLLATIAELRPAARITSAEIAPPIKQQAIEFDRDGGSQPGFDTLDTDAQTGSISELEAPARERVVADIQRLTQQAPTGAGHKAKHNQTAVSAKPPAFSTNLESYEMAPLWPVGLGAWFVDNLLLVVGLACAIASAIGTVMYLTRRPRGGGHPESDRPFEGARLIDLAGVSGKEAYPLTGKLARICRNAGQDTFNVVCITISDDVISREHAYIEYRDGKYWLSDPGSNNGTFVNGKRIRGRCELRDGDRLRFATFEFLFQDEADLDQTDTYSASTEAPTTIDPLATQVGARPIGLVGTSEDKTIVATMAYRPTANEDTQPPITHIRHT